MKHGQSKDDVNTTNNSPLQQSSHGQADEHDNAFFPNFKTTYQDIESSHLTAIREECHDAMGRLELQMDHDQNVTDDDRQLIEGSTIMSEFKEEASVSQHKPNMEGIKRSFRWFSVSILSICLLGSLLYPMEDKIRRRAQPRTSLDYGVHRFRKVIDRYLGNNNARYNNYYNVSDDEQNVNDDVAIVDDLYMNATNGTYYEGETYYTPPEGEF
jgi:hypothetical protein